MDVLVEACRCYYVGRKISALLGGVGMFLAAYFGLQKSPLGSSLVIVISVCIGIFSANIIYVISSESFCTGIRSSNVFESAGSRRIFV